MTRPSRARDLPPFPIESTEVCAMPSGARNSARCQRLPRDESIAGPESNGKTDGGTAEQVEHVEDIELGDVAPVDGASIPTLAPAQQLLTLERQSHARVEQPPADSVSE
jgi:hypothetical protein